MREFVNDFQSIVKINRLAPQEKYNIDINGCNSVIIYNNTLTSLIRWENLNNNINPNSFRLLRGNENESLKGYTSIIFLKQLFGALPTCTIIRKKFINATI